jgi:hypothetical protein
MLVAFQGDVMAEIELSSVASPDRFFIDEKEGVPVTIPGQGQRLSLPSLLQALRRNILSVWPKHAYERDVFGFKLLQQRYIVCNNAESVRRVFLSEHDNYDRKSPQMRHARCGKRVARCARLHLNPI